MAERRLKFPARTNIRDLPGKIMLKARQALDTRSLNSVAAWRAFALRLSGVFTYKSQDVEYLAQLSYRGSSSAWQMLLDLGAKGMNVSDFVNALNDLQMEDVLAELIEHEDVQIISQPEPFVKVREGERVVLSVKGRGFPYPRCLWFRFDPKLDDSKQTSHCDANLVINKASLDDAGDYCCMVYNTKTKGIFSDWCTISVLPVPKPESHGPMPATNQALHPTMQSPMSDKGGPVHTMPYILQQPWSVNVHVDTPTVLLCEACGHLPLSYQWQRNGVPISTLQTGYLKIAETKLEDDGVYQCVVSNDFGSVRSACIKVSVAASEWENFAAASVIPEIQEHPKSCVVQLGGHAIFRCLAHGQGPLKYQWFKDCDSIPGATQNEHRVYDIKVGSMQGSFMCLVSNDYGQVLSKGAILQIGNISYKTNHFATDKVALLMGNYDYRSQQPLKAPQTDIQNLSHIFQHLLGFKVVSLLNLTLMEMISAVEEFCELIDSGVYCVFYFCGHGFDENKQSYMLPNDVPTDYKTEECLSAEYVLRKMQQRRPKICCMILDICRKPAENPSQNRSKTFLEQTPVDGNTVVLYATSHRLAAFEFRPESKGILVTHLEKLLPQPLSIEEVFRRVKTAVGKDSRVSRNSQTLQLPEFCSNLTDSDRSFTDPIETSGHTRACNERQLAWENAHVKPPPMEVYLQPKELGVMVELTFQHEFSNVLSVFVKVQSKGNLSDCIAWISKLPSSVTMMKKPTCVSPEGAEFTMTKNVIIDIQKLRENLRVSLAMRYRLPGSGPYDYIYSTDTQIDLQMPLVAGLRLWSTRSIQSPSRRAVEQTEDDKVDA